MTSFLLGRDGKISIFRVGIAAAVLGVLFAIGGFVVFALEGNTYKSPLFIDPYPGAQQWGDPKNLSDSERTIPYQIKGATPEQVLEYYQKKLDDIYHQDPNEPNAKCQRFPPTGNFPDFDNHKPGVVAYYYSCAFERTGFRASQSTIVTIQPGIHNDDPKLNTEGMTIVQYTQQWEP